MARQYFEDIAKGFCQKKNIKITYRRKAKELKLDHFWGEIKTFAASTLDAQLVTDINANITTVYNPLSHGNPVNISRQEVKQAIDALKKVKAEFDR